MERDLNTPEQSLVAQLESNPVGRRDVVTKLFGALGIATLTGCGPDLKGSTLADTPDDIAMQQAALAAIGSDVKSVSTALGPVGADGKRQGNLATQASADLGGATVVIAHGCVTPGDGGGGVFYWSESGTHDGGTFIVPSGTASGGWRRIYSGAISVKWFGALGNGITDTDDTAAINAAVIAASAPGAISKTVYVPSGTYMVDTDFQTGKSVRLLSGVELHLDSKAVLKAKPTEPTDRKTGAVIFIFDCDNVLVEGGTILGEWDGTTNLAKPFLHGIKIYGSTQVRVRRMKVDTHWGDGICIEFNPTTNRESEEVHIDSVRVDGAGRNGISVINCRAGSITNSTIRNTSLTSIDLEPATSANPRPLVDFTISSCRISGKWIQVGRDCARILIEGNNIDGDESAIQWGGIWVCSPDVIVRGNLVDGGPRGIFISAGAPRCVVEGNKLLNITHFGIDVRYGSDSVVADNIVTGAAGYGVRVESAPRTIVKGNNISGTPRIGIAILPNTDPNEKTDTPNSNDCVVSDNILSGMTEAGICVESALRAIVKGNNISGMPRDGIYVRDGSNDTVVADNILSGTTGTGITAIRCKYVSVSGNMVLDTGTTCLYGIYAGTRDSVTSGFVSVKSNTVKRAAKHGILIESSDTEVAGNTVIDSSLSAHDTYHGIYVSAATVTRVRITQNVLRATPGNAIKPRYGVYTVNGASACVIEDNDFMGAVATSEVLVSPTLSAAIVGRMRDNLGVARETKSGTGQFDFLSVGTGQMESTNVVVEGAAVGDAVSVGFSGVLPAGCILTGTVTESHTVRVTVLNMSGVTASLAGYLRVSVM